MFCATQNLKKTALFVSLPRYTVHSRLWYHARTTDTWWLNHQFFAAQMHIPNPNIYSLKNVFKAWLFVEVMVDYNIPQFIWPICPNRPIFGLFLKKSSHHMSIVHDTRRGSDTFLGLFMLGCFCIWNASATNFENRCRILSFIKPCITMTTNSYFCPKIIKIHWPLTQILIFTSFCNILFFNLDINE